MEIRELKAKDVRILAKMLGKLRSSSLGDIFSLLDRKESDPLKVGLSLFRVVSADLTDDLYSWLASLIGKTAEELDEMPADTPVEIVKSLIQGGRLSSFLELASRQAEIPKGSKEIST
jgi:hypothetical protein